MITKISLQVFKIIILVFILISILFWFLSYNYKTEVLDHYGSFIGGLLGTVLSFLSIILVVYTLHDQKANEESQKNEYLNDKLIYLHNLVSQSINFSTKFYKSLTTFSLNIEQNPIILPQLVLHEIPKNIERLATKINQEEYYLAYKKILGTNEIIDIFNIADVIYNEYLMTIEQIKNHQLYDFERKSELVIEVRKIIERVTNDLQEIQGGINFTGFQLLFNHLKLEYEQIIKLKHDDFKSIEVQILNVLINETSNTKYSHLADEARKIISKIHIIESKNQKIASDFRKLLKNLKSYNTFLKTDFTPLNNYIRV